MTAAKKKNSRRKQARFRSSRRKRIRNTVLLKPHLKGCAKVEYLLLIPLTFLLGGLLLLLFVVLGGTGIGAIYVLRNGTVFDKLEDAYVASREFSGGITDLDSLRADGFAKNLCVVVSDVPMDGVSLGENQKGLLLDLDDRKVLYSKQALQKVYPASITKIMTAMLALKYGNMDDVVTITQENLNLEEGSQVCGFWAGDQVTMDQLLHCLLVYSGNDAAAAIAEHVGGSTDGFVEMMNSYARELGCTGTHFTNPHGLQDENHYTTPYDIYLMLKEALNYPEFTQITQSGSYTVEYTHADGSSASTTLLATDHYLTGEATPPKNVTILGGKTGTTDNAGNCLALLSQNAYGKPYISIVMGAATKDELYEQMSSLLQNIN